MQSMTSLGRVGRILAGSVDASIISIERDANSANMSPSSQQASTSLSSNSVETSKICKEVSKEDVRDSPVMPRTESTNVVLQGNCCRYILDDFVEILRSIFSNLNLTDTFRSLLFLDCNKIEMLMFTNIFCCCSKCMP